MRRIRKLRLFRSPFKNIALESGLSDEEAVHSVQPPIYSKTFARLRTSPLETIALDQLLMIARLAAATAPVDAADVLGMLRDPDRYRWHPFYPVLVADIYERSAKQLLEVAHMVQAIAPTISHIYLFDNGDSLAYLSGQDHGECPDSFSSPPPPPPSPANRRRLPSTSDISVALAYQPCSPVARFSGGKSLVVMHPSNICWAMRRWASTASISWPMIPPSRTAYYPAFSPAPRR